MDTIHYLNPMSSIVLFIADVKKCVECANGGDSVDVMDDSRLCKHSDQTISFTVRLRPLHSYLTASTHVEIDKNVLVKCKLTFSRIVFIETHTDKSSQVYYLYNAFTMQIVSK